MRNKVKTPPYPSPSFSRLNFNPSFPLFYLPLPISAGGWRMGSCGQSMITPLCCSFLLTLFPCPGMGPLWAAVLQDKPAPAGALPSGNICLLPHGSSLGSSVDICSSVVSTGATSLQQKFVLLGSRLLNRLSHKPCGRSHLEGVGTTEKLELRCQKSRCISGSVRAKVCY